MDNPAVPKLIILAESIVYLICAIGLFGTLSAPPRISVLIGVVIMWLAIASTGVLIHRGRKAARGWWSAIATFLALACLLVIKTIPFVAIPLFVVITLSVILLHLPSSSKWFSDMTALRTASK